MNDKTSHHSRARIKMKMYLLLGNGDEKKNSSISIDFMKYANNFA